METESPDDLTVTYTDVITEHRVWLKQFSGQRLDKWENLLKNSFEAAICEAKTRELLSDHKVDVQPYEDFSKGGPDFICTKNGKMFYVETTCISVEAATKESELQPVDNPEIDDSAYRNMTEKFRSEITEKSKQCRKVKAPCIVVVTTLHPKASDCCIDDLAVEELLTGCTYYTTRRNDETYEITRLENSVFLRPQKGSKNLIEDARTSVSAVLLCGFDSNPPNVIGCLHHNPNYPFDRTLLNKIRFCRLADGYQNGSFRVEWI
jgi:hypothetical protein